MCTVNADISPKQEKKSVFGDMDRLGKQTNNVFFILSNNVNVSRPNTNTVSAGRLQGSFSLGGLVWD